MTDIHLLPKKERQIFFDTAVSITGIPFPLLEKDFWVVWVLERLFSLQGLKSYLTFKGGTSLSKVYGVIQRFSEDIDLSIEKEFLGFTREKDPERADDEFKMFWKAIEQIEKWAVGEEDFLEKLHISGVHKKRGVIVEYFATISKKPVWISKEESLRLAKEGRLHATIVHLKNGTVYLRPEAGAKPFELIS